MINPEACYDCVTEGGYVVGGRMVSRGIDHNGVPLEILSAPLDTAPVLTVNVCGSDVKIKGDASVKPGEMRWEDAGPLGMEIEEFQSAQAREVYDKLDAIRKYAPAEFGVQDPNPKQRFGDLKVALQLVPPALAIHAAKALKEGADKYGAYNWRTQPVEAMTYIGGLLRHAAAYLDGEDIDPESTTGKSHLDGMAANIAILLDALDLGTLIDNRPPKGPAPKLVRTPK